MVPRSKNIKQFQDWTTKILFTHHLGTQKQKDDLAASLIGINSRTIKDVFRSATNKTPVVYLFLIGYAYDSLKDKKYDYETLLCKFGCTEDIAKRTSQHETKYRKEYGSNVSMELLAYTIVDPKILFEVERNIRDYFKLKRSMLVCDNKSELILVNKTIL
jgi:predicted GIY-YIG superfamily endonuclease